MSIITIPNPQTKTFVQSNTSDVLGTMQNSFNIDLQENVGKMRVGKRMVIGSTVSDVASMYCPVAFAYAYKSGGNKIFSLCGNNNSTGKVATQTGLHNNAGEDNTANAPADIDTRYSDMMVASNGYLYATSNDSLYEMDGNGNWSATPYTSLATSTTHMLTGYAGRLYVTNLYNTILSVDISTGARGAFTSIGSPYNLRLGLDSEANTITFIRSSASRIWIGTINRRGGKGYVHEWDGQATIVTKSYRLESSGALSCVIKDEIPYIVDTNGDLLSFNGGTFQKLTGFYRKNRKRKLINPLSSWNDRFIHPNGMSVIDGRINILINNQNNDYNFTSIEETIQSGIYEYTPENGLVHKHSFGLAKSSDTIKDYGQIRVKQVGALSEILIPDNDTSTSNGSFLAGARVYTDATTEAGYIFYDDTNDTLEKYGYFITPQIESSQLTDTWQKIYLKNKKLINSSDRIYIKSRTEEDTGVEATITWTSTTSFTVLNSAVDVSLYWTSGTGGEIEITQGIGGGKTAHITNAVNNSGTWTVTVDETFTGATGTAKARFMKWNKLKTINNDESINNQVQQFTEFPIPEYDKNDTFIQFKICFLFKGKNEMHSLNIISKTNQPLI